MVVSSKNVWHGFWNPCGVNYRYTDSFSAPWSHQTAPDFQLRLQLKLQYPSPPVCFHLTTGPHLVWPPPFTCGVHSRVWGLQQWPITLQPQLWSLSLTKKAQCAASSASPASFRKWSKQIGGSILQVLLSDIPSGLLRLSDLHSTFSFPLNIFPLGGDQLIVQPKYAEHEATSPVPWLQSGSLSSGSLRPNVRCLSGLILFFSNTVWQQHSSHPHQEE